MYPQPNAPYGQPNPPSNHFPPVDAPPPQPPRRSKTPWIIGGIGCGGLLVIACLVLGFFAVSSVRNASADERPPRASANDNEHTAWDDAADTTSDQAVGTQDAADVPGGLGNARLKRDLWEVVLGAERARYCAAPTLQSIAVTEPLNNDQWQETWFVDSCGTSRMYLIELTQVGDGVSYRIRQL